MRIDIILPINILLFISTGVIFMNASRGNQEKGDRKQPAYSASGQLTQPLRAGPHGNNKITGNIIEQPAAAKPHTDELKNKINEIESNIAKKQALVQASAIYSGLLSRMNYTKEGQRSDLIRLFGERNLIINDYSNTASKMGDPDLDYTASLAAALAEIDKAILESTSPDEKQMVSDALALGQRYNLLNALDNRLRQSGSPLNKNTFSGLMRATLLSCDDPNISPFDYPSATLAMEKLLTPDQAVKFRRFVAQKQTEEAAAARASEIKKK